MTYTTKQLARLAGITSRSLRFYDQIGLLSPRRITHNSYRVYTQTEVDLLQQILFYRELGLRLEEIKTLLSSEDFDEIETLKSHLAALMERKQQIDTIIHNVQNTIASKEGKKKMSDEQKFEGLKKHLVEENDRAFGKEIREKYGEQAVEDSNARMMGLSQDQYTAMQKLSAEINEKLKLACQTGDSASSLAQEVCDLHRQWLGYTWKTYSKQSHLSLGQMYIADERFKAYYDAIAPGCAEFLAEALKIYCQ